MDSAARPPLQRGTPTRSAIRPDQPLTVQEFLRSLKKPTRPLSTSEGFETPQEKSFQSSPLSVQAFLHGLRKPVTPLRKPAEVAEGPKLKMVASGKIESAQSIAAASRPSFLDPPEPTSNRMDSEGVPSPSLEAKRLRCSTPNGKEEKDVPVKIPKVIRTYTKKAKHVSPQQRDSPALFLTQSSTHKGVLIDGLHDDSPDSPTERLASREASKDRPVKKHTSVVLQKRKRHPLRENEEIRQVGHNEDDADMLIWQKQGKKRRKGRRAPVNQLALVTGILGVSPAKSQVRTSFGQCFIWVSVRQGAQSNANFVGQKAYDSDNAIDLLNAYLDEQRSPASTSPSCEKTREPMRANVGKPVTRFREEITIPTREVLAREGFRFPPITPRAKKSPGWRLGSGFEGITLDLATRKRPETSRNRKVRHTRSPSFLGRTLPELELSSRLSPIRQSISQRGILKRQKDRNDPFRINKNEPAREHDTADGATEVELPSNAAKTDGKIACEQMTNLTIPKHPSIENDQLGTAPAFQTGTIKGPNQLHSNQARNLDASTAIREPSKSERNGWLKRPRVDFAVADEDDEEHLLVQIQRTAIDSRENGISNQILGLDTYFEGPGQTQHAVGNVLQTFNGGGQPTPNAERPVSEEHGSGFEDEILDYQSSNSPPQPPPCRDSNRTDFLNSPLHAKGLSIPNARHHVQVPRTSEVPETQDRPQESIELDHIRTESQSLGLHSYHIPATSLDSGNYFSKAVQQLDSPEKIPHTVTRRRSRREPVQDLRGSQIHSGRQRGAHLVTVAPSTGEQRFKEQEGSLELGMTPRLKRRMSNVPFRPPFKEPL